MRNVMKAARSLVFVLSAVPLLAACSTCSSDYYDNHSSERDRQTPSEVEGSFDSLPSHPQEVNDTGKGAKRMNRNTSINSTNCRTRKSMPESRSFQCDLTLTNGDSDQLWFGINGGLSIPTRYQVGTEREVDRIMRREGEVVEGIRGAPKIAFWNTAHRLFFVRGHESVQVYNMTFQTMGENARPTGKYITARRIELSTGQTLEELLSSEPSGVEKLVWSDLLVEFWEFDQPLGILFVDTEEHDFRTNFEPVEKGQP